MSGDCNLRSLTGIPCEDDPVPIDSVFIFFQPVTFFSANELDGEAAAFLTIMADSKVIVFPLLESILKAELIVACTLIIRMQSHSTGVIKTRKSIHFVSGFRGGKQLISPALGRHKSEPGRRSLFCHFHIHSISDRDRRSIFHLRLRGIIFSALPTQFKPESCRLTVRISHGTAVSGPVGKAVQINPTVYISKGVPFRISPVIRQSAGVGRLCRADLKCNHHCRSIICDNSGILTFFCAHRINI